MTLHHFHVGCHRSLLVAGLSIAGALTIQATAFSQGCTPATVQHLPHGLLFEQFDPCRFDPGADPDCNPETGTAGQAVGGGGDSTGALPVRRAAGNLQLVALRAWTISTSFRAFKSGDKFIGSNEIAAQRNEAVGEFRSLDLTGTYADGFYLINPRETNGTVTPAAKFLLGSPIPLSVADQYQVRAGIGYLAWPRHGLSLSLGVRMDGIPRHDLLGARTVFAAPATPSPSIPGSTSTGERIP